MRADSSRNLDDSKKRKSKIWLQTNTLSMNSKEEENNFLNRLECSFLNGVK